MFDNDTPPLQRIYEGSHVKILVLGRTLIRDVAPDVPYIVISVTDPERPYADIMESPLLRAVLRLQFHDNGQAVDIPGLEGMSLGTGPTVVMTTDDAKTILAFVQSHLSQVELIICQCEAGVSRSAGIAAALSRILQGNDEFFFRHYWPNRFVYQTLLEAS